MEPKFDLKDTVLFYCPSRACSQAITFRQLEEYFGKQSMAWTAGKFSCPHCNASLARKVIRRFDSWGFQWIPEFIENQPT